MKKHEAIAAMSILSYRCRHIEIAGDAKNGFFVCAFWVDGGEKFFYHLVDVEQNHDDYLTRLAVFILSKRVPNNGK